MAAVTALSVDGQHGTDIAKSIFTKPPISTSLAPRNTVRIRGLTPFTVLLMSPQEAAQWNGADGAAASAATPGGPGGFLAVQLSSPSGDPEGFLVNVIAQSPPDQVQERIEVAAQRNLLLSAVGGNGEPGRQGGNGERGRTGTEGSHASRENDAGVSFRPCLPQITL